MNNKAQVHILEVISIVGLIAIALFFFENLNITSSVDTDSSIEKLKEIGDGILSSLDRKKPYDDTYYENTLEEWIIIGMDDDNPEQNNIKNDFRVFIDDNFFPNLPSYNVYIYTYPSFDLDPEADSNKIFLLSSIKNDQELIPGGDQEITRVHRFVVHNAEVYDVELCIWYSN